VRPLPRRLIGATLAVLAVGAAAAPATGAARLRGKVPLRGAPRAGARATNLTYHGGLVMHANRTYTIFWIPPGFTVAGRYRGAVNRYLSDVATASGTTANVYAPLSQYFDKAGPITYTSTFGGTATDITPFPAGGCRPTTGLVACVTDKQVRAEVQRVARERGWVADATSLFVLLTPRAVGACESRTSTSCAFTAWCGYHSNIGTGPTATLYTLVPYGETAPGSCGSREHPTGAEADATINTLSHEHREAISDPFGDAWFDAAGREGSDKCAWNFGKAAGTTPGGAYTNLINGHPYYLQTEWSNASRACVQRS
jgi:hypothetical protein